MSRSRQIYAPLNEAGQAALREYYLAGYTSRQIAEGMGKSHDAIKSYLRRMGISKRAIEDKRGRVAECIAEGMSFAQTAKALGMSESAVKGMFKRIREEMGAQAI